MSETQTSKFAKRFAADNYNHGILIGHTLDFAETKSHFNNTTFVLNTSTQHPYALKDASLNPCNWILTIGSSILVKQYSLLKIIRSILLKSQNAK